MFEASADTYIDRWAPDANYHSEPKLSLRQNDVRVPLLRFDLSPVPSGARVERAVLSLYALGRSNRGTLALDVYQVVRPWDEEQCSWKLASAGQPWARTGCNAHDVDRSSSSAHRIRLDRADAWYSLDLTHLVQSWVDRPWDNHGIVLKGREWVAVQYDLGSADHQDARVRPVLSVLWESGEPSEQAPYPHPPWAEPSPPAAATASPGPPPQPVRDTFRLDDENGGVSDTFLDVWAPETNHAGELRMSVRQDVRTSLIRIDLGRVPPQSSVLSASLRMFAIKASNSAPLIIGIAKVSCPWDESVVDWVRTTTSSAWEQEGARDVPEDRSARVYARATLTAERSWVEWDLTDLVQEWVSGVSENHGVLLVGTSSIAVQYDLVSSQWQQEEYRPYLEVAYVAVNPSPTPRATDTAESTQPIATATIASTSTPMPALSRLTLQYGRDGYEGAADTYLDSWYQEASWGDVGSLNVRQDGVRVGLLRFDLSHLPPGAKVREARLSLWASAHRASATSNRGKMILRAYRMLHPWQVDTATWVQSEAGVLWEAAGAGAEGHDRAVNASAETAISDGRRWVSLDVTEAVQRWLQEPGENHGLMLRGEGAVSVEVQFASSQSSEPSQRPKLLIAFGDDENVAGALVRRLSVAQWLGIALALSALCCLLLRSNQMAQAHKAERRAVD